MIPDPFWKCAIIKHLRLENGLTPNGVMFKDKGITGGKCEPPVGFKLKIHVDTVLGVYITKTQS